MVEAIMMASEQSLSPLAFRHVWRALDTLCDAADPETAYQLALQVVYLRCRPAPFGVGLARHSGPAEPALNKAWATLRFDHRFRLGASRSTSTRRLFGEADRALAAVIAEVDRLDEPADLFDACLDRYSSRFLEGGDYYTSRGLARLMAGLAAPRPGERVLDPVCGCGRLLIAAAQSVHEEYGRSDELHIHGRDVRGEARRAAAMNLMLNELRPDLGDKAVDSLRDGLTRLSADIILANPPLNMKDWGYQELSGDSRWSLGLPPQGNANFAWVQHILSELSPRGRAVVLLPDSATRGFNSAEARIRQRLVDTDLLAAVVSLPTGIFPHTRTGTTLWLLSKNKNPHASWGQNSRTGEVLFADARQLATRRDRSGRHLANADIDRICRIFAVWRGIRLAQDGDVPDGVSWCQRARQDDIARRGYDLSPGSYIQTQPASVRPGSAEDEDRPPKELLYEHFEDAARVSVELRRVLEVSLDAEYLTKTPFEPTQESERWSHQIHSHLGRRERQ